MVNEDIRTRTEHDVNADEYRKIWLFMLSLLAEGFDISLVK